MRQSVMISIVAGMSLLAGSSGLHAAVLLEDHFEAPDTTEAAPGDWAVPGSVTATIVDTSGDTHPSPDPLGTQAMAITNGSSGYVNRGFAEQTAGTFQTEAYVRVNPSGSDTLVMVVSGAAGGGPLLFFTGGYLYYGQNGGYSNSGFAMNGDDWYDVTITTNLDAKNWDVSVVNLSNNAQFISPSSLAFFGSNAADKMSNLGFGPIYGGVDATVDNVKIATVPEPSSLVLLFVGGLLMRRRRM